MIKKSSLIALFAALMLTGCNQEDYENYERSRLDLQDTKCYIYQYRNKFEKISPSSYNYYYRGFCRNFPNGYFVKGVKNEKEFYPVIPDRTKNTLSSSNTRTFNFIMFDLLADEYDYSNNFLRFSNSVVVENNTTKETYYVPAKIIGIPI